MIVDVIVKWNRDKFNVSVNTTESLLEFKTQIYSLTGVPPDRQKVMVNGKLIQNLDFKNKQLILMMGSADELAAPQKTVFLEDMSDSQIAKVLNLPAGLVNMGNTCYMNACIQCLSAISDLPLALPSSTISSDPLSNLASCLKSLFSELKGSTAVPPLVFLQVLRTLFPQFNERDSHGYMQQDAEECWSQVINALNQKVPGLSPNASPDSSRKFVDQFLAIETIAETICDQDPSDKSVASESMNKINVNIGSGVSTYMVADIANGLVEKIEKRSESTNTTALYTKTAKFSRLPKYLAINFIRFQWKPQEKIKAKILKRVQYPFELDMVPYCTPDLQAKLAPAKEHLKKAADQKAEIAKRLKTDEPQAEAPILKDQVQILKEIQSDDCFIKDPGLNPSGQYDLVAVLTHVGRAADSGHYIGWVKNGQDWWKFDDDKVSKVTEDEIKKLEGGGDWHTAYICLYKAKPLE